MKYFALFLLAILVFACNITAEEPASENKTTAPTNTYYQEAHRPQYHFSPEEMWMNDPNGMVYYDGEYHLFYQHYPDSNVWGPMHWGHAVSEDLVHWEHLPIALYPDSLGLIFSGSAVIDWKNTTGFGTEENPPMIAIYTYHDMEGEQNGKKDFQTQGIAYSTDKGRTWTKYDANPVIPNDEDIFDFRDPKVSWHEASQQWVMILAANDRVKLYTSPDLKDWTFTSDFGMTLGSQARPWECPDLFELETDNGDKKWVMLVSIGNRIETQGPNGGSATQYFVGDFDGKTFTLDPQFKQEVTDGKPMWIDFGRDNYAGVTWSDVPEEDGRRLFLGWMSNWNYATVVPTSVWRSAMTLPRTLALKQTNEGYRLFTQPVKELEQLRGEKIEIKDLITDLADINPEKLELIIEIEKPEKDFVIALKNNKNEVYRIGYNGERNEFFSDRTKSGDSSFSDKFASEIHTAPRLLDSETVKMQLFFDRSSVELFADDGSVLITDIFFPSEVFSQIQIESETEIGLNNVACYELKSIW